MILASTISSPYSPTVVFLHGLNNSKVVFSEVIRRLADAGQPAIALDLRGHGQSALGDASEFGCRAAAEDVLATLDHHGLRDPVVIVGHSMGGRVAISVAAIDCEAVARGARPRLAALVVVDQDVVARTSGPGDSPPDDALSEDQRAVLELSYFLGMSHGQIAEALNLPVGTVKSRILAGMRALRTMLPIIHRSIRV